MTDDTRITVFREPGPEWLAFETALDGRRVPLALYGRADWVRTRPETVWLVGVSDANGTPACGIPVVVGRSRSLPGARILRSPRFGYGLEPAAADAACAALADLARRVSPLRLHVELYAPEPEVRASLPESLARAGFVREPAARSYERTILIDLRPAEEQVLASFHRTCRQNIRGLAKYGLECRAIDDPSLAGRMNALVSEAMTRTAGPQLAEDWGAWLALIRARPDLAHLVGVFRNDASGPDALVGLVLGLRHGDMVEYSVAASTRIPGSRAPILYAPTWRLMQWGRSVGATTFDFGGVTAGTVRTADPVGGISDFKRSFGGSIVEVGGEFVLEPSPWRSALARAISAAAGIIRPRGTPPKAARPPAESEVSESAQVEE